MGGRLVVCIVTVALLVTSHVAAGDVHSADSRPHVETRSFGPQPEEVRLAASKILALPVVRAVLAGKRHHLVSFELVDGYEATPTPSNAFLATIVDYSSARTVLVRGRLSDVGDVKISFSNDQPVPDAAEFDAAVAVVRRDPLLGPRLTHGELRPYRPMPPIVANPVSAGRVDRTLTVGLLPAEGQSGHEIVGVNMFLERVVRYPTGAPPTAQATESTCGPSPATDATPQRGTAGQTEVTISHQGMPLWHFYVVRPAASSGTNGSGIEIRYVDYRGKRVLARAHVPIVNVNYQVDECGPFRDWLWQEGGFRSEGFEVAPGHQRCVETPLTVNDDGVDEGDFYGVSYYLRGDDVVLATEMNAGWYRYIQEWIFTPDGGIKPKFRFAAVENSCTCKAHIHHAYWRFDFNIGGSANNRVEEFTGGEGGSQSWESLAGETSRVRAANRAWRVRNTGTGAGYLILPSPGDGDVDPFGVSDFWVLQQHAHEIDDGRGVNTGRALVPAGLDEFVDGEAIDDAVVWYGIHISHVEGDNADHVGGPNLIPFDWS